MLYSCTFFAMAFANFMCLSSFGAFFLFPIFITERGGDQVDIGIIMGAFSFASVLFRPWISEMIDKMGRKRSYTVGSFLMTVVPLAYALFDGRLSTFYVPLAAARIAHGIGFAICITAAFTFIADLVPEKRINEGIGMFGVSGLVGSAVGPAVAEFVIRRHGFDALFFTASAMGALSLLVHLPLKESYVHVSRVVHTSFFSVLKRERIATVAVIAALFGFGLAATNSFVSPFAKERQVAFISLYYVSYSTAAILTRFFGGRLADRVGEDRIIPYALFATGVGLMTMIPLEDCRTLLASGFLTGCGHGFLYPSLSTLAIRDEPAAVKGKITGVYTGSIDAGALAGSLLLGVVGEYAGFRILFLCAGFSLLAGLGVFKARISGPRGGRNPL